MGLLVFLEGLLFFLKMGKYDKQLLYEADKI